jgi:hypothetical protein
VRSKAAFVHVAGAAAAHPQTIDDFLDGDVVLYRRHLEHAVNVVDPDDVRADTGMVLLELRDDSVPGLAVGLGPKLVDVKLKLFGQST